MVCLTVTYIILPNREEEAVELFKKIASATRKEPGCRLFLAHQSLADRRRFFLYEQYDDEAAIAAHRATPHFDEYVQRGLFRILETRTPELYALLSG